MLGENKRRLMVLENLLNGNGKPGIISELHELRRLGDLVELSHARQEEAARLNRQLLWTIFGGLAANVIASHWSAIVAVLG
jgi:hypothetical protein